MGACLGFGLLILLLILGFGAGWAWTYSTLRASQTARAAGSPGIGGGTTMYCLLGGASGSY